jgi:uncharacterized protein (DUF362 family)
MERSLTRREFGAVAAGGLACFTLARGASAAAEDLWSPPAALSYAGGAETPVAVRAIPRGGNEGATVAAVRSAAQAATDFSWLSRGDSVLLKPACNSGNPYPATTDPVALRAVIGLLKEKGAGRVIVADMSGVQFVRFSKDELSGSTRALMESAGMARAVIDAGAEVHAFEEAGWDGFFEAMPQDGDSWKGPLMLPAVLREVDHVILMPRCSRHLLAGSTLALKAAVGWWRHDSRLEYHRDAATFSEKTADANSVAEIRDKQRLVLTSATRMLTTFGPDEGYVLEPDHGIVFASEDLVSHDVLSAAWLLKGRRATPSEHKDGVFDDPNNSALFVNVVNRMIVRWLGGFGEMLRSESLTRYDLQTVWDDRVLRRAFEIFGGVPRVRIADENRTLPRQLRDDLQTAVTLPVQPNL